MLPTRSSGTLFSENGMILLLSSFRRPFIGIRIERSMTVSGSGFSDANALGQNVLNFRTTFPTTRRITPDIREKPAFAIVRRQLSLCRAASSMTTVGRSWSTVRKMLGPVGLTTNNPFLLIPEIAADSVVFAHPFTRSEEHTSELQSLRH